MKNVFLLIGLFITLSVQAQDNSLKEYVGKYLFSDGMEAQVVIDGQLKISSNLGAAYLTRAKVDTFAVDEYGGQVIFYREKGNIISAVKVDIPAAGLDIKGERMTDTTSVPVPTAVVSTPNDRSLFITKGEVDLEAHGGGCGLWPCNTIPAFINAVKQGANTLEMDCVISKDSMVLVSHDQFMDFTIRTPEGKDEITGENQLDYNIFTMPYDSVRKYDAGSKVNPYFPKQHKLVTYKPLLSEVIDSVERYVKAHKLAPVKYNIEVKSLRGDHVYHPAPDVFTDLMVKVIHDKGLTDRVVIQSFDIRALQYLHTHYPAFRTSYLVSVKNTNSLQDNINRLGFVPDIYSPEFPMVNGEMVQQVHAFNMNLVPWTIDKQEDIEDILKLGVDGIITNYPDIALKLISARK